MQGRKTWFPISNTFGNTWQAPQTIFFPVNLEHRESLKGSIASNTHSFGDLPPATLSLRPLCSNNGNQQQKNKIRIIKFLTEQKDFFTAKMRAAIGERILLYN